LAQSTYPSQTVKIIVPFTPGTGMDTIARVVAPRLSERLGQPVVVQNQPGWFCDPAASCAAARALANEADKGDGVNAIPQ
jgi:tripartite-type tricarboxylate transporter receptor subunit TctC